MKAKTALGDKPPAPLYDAFAEFFSNPTLADFRALLASHLGEMNAYDFKEQWPEYSAVAKHILGIANYGGGCVVLGVKENDDKSFTPVGLQSVHDTATVSRKLGQYLPTDLMDAVHIQAYVFTESEYPAVKGKSFQVIRIAPDLKHSPFLAKAETTGLRDNMIYTRRGTETRGANHDEIQRIINRRLETGYSSSRELSLKEHLEQLKILYDEAPASFTKFSPALSNVLQKALTLNDTLQNVPNPDYPTESYSAFLSDCIRRKKNRIREDLGI